MIAYLMVGTNDFDASVAFFDELLKELDGKRLMGDDDSVAWTKGGSWDEIGFCVCKPYDKNEATVGNGCMVGLSANSEEQVKAVYNKALELGGTDEGEPGPRGEQFYGAYFRDLDGNKFSVMYVRAS